MIDPILALSRVYIGFRAGLCFRWGVAVIIVLSALLQTAWAASPALTFGIVPQQSASKLALSWTPLLNRISQETGVQLHFATAPDIREFERRLREGQYDLAYMNPYHYTVFSRVPGYRAFAKEKDKRIRGILVVRHDSGIESLEQLKQQKLAFPSPAAFAASVLTRAHLRNRGIAFEPAYVSSHDSVYRAVAQGLFAAGGGIERTFENVTPEVRSQLRVLWRSQMYTPHAITAHPRVPPEVVEKVMSAMAGLADSEEGRALLAVINFKGIEPANDRDWDDVRALGIDLLEGLIQ